MVGSDETGPAAGAPQEAAEPAVPVASAALAGVAAAAGVGVLFAGFALAHDEALRLGAALPVRGWLSGWTEWLPWACIGLGLARLTLVLGAARNGLRLLAVAAGLLVAVAGLLGFRDLPGLLPVAAGLLGIAIGWRCEHARRVGVVAVPVAGLVAAVAAIATARLLSAETALVMAMVLSLSAMAPRLPQTVARSDASGRWLWPLLGWTGVLAGSCWLVSTSAPAAAPRLAAFVAIVFTAAAIGRVGLACGATAAMLAITVFVPVPAISARADVEVVLARCGEAALVYRRADQEMQLRLKGTVVAAAGPDRDEEPLCEALVHTFARDGDRVMLLGSGCGRVAAGLSSSGRLVVERTACWPELEALHERAMLDGPVPPPGAWRAATGAVGRAFTDLQQLADGSRQVIVVAELPTEVTRHRASAEFQRELRRVVGRGLVVQPMAVDRTRACLVRDLLGAARTAHRWNGVFVVGTAAVLVSAASPPATRRDFANWSEAARWALHRAHLGGPADVWRALAGLVPLHAPLAEHGDLADWLVTAEPDANRRAAAGDSLLEDWQLRRELLQSLRDQVFALADTPSDRGRAAALAARLLHSNHLPAWAAAALGLRDESGLALRDPALASRTAFAIDPTFFRSAPPVFASLPRPVQAMGDLEDLMRVEVGERLAVRCAGDAPLAVALRARFPDRCARSLLARLRGGPLPMAQVEALRALADPFVLGEALRILLPAGRWRELLPLWRQDVPAPPALAAIARGRARADRVALLAALTGRRDAGSYSLLADFLVDDDREILVMAAEALRQAVGQRVPFDPAWSRSKRQLAASRLRALHNRKP